MNIRTFVAILSRNPRFYFLKMRGGSKAVWNFSENSSDLETWGSPFDWDNRWKPLKEIVTEGRLLFRVWRGRALPSRQPEG